MLRVDKVIQILLARGQRRCTEFCVNMVRSYEQIMDSNILLHRGKSIQYLQNCSNLRKSIHLSGFKVPWN